MRALDLTGRKFGRLTALAVTRRGGLRVWMCRCVCGNETIVHTRDLISGKSRSCGCAKATRGGMTTTPEGKVWYHMMRRCYDRTNVQYRNYGGRGIRVCRRWHKIENFISDMGVRPPSYTLERRDNDLGYSPANCVWATRMVQGRNNRRNRMVTLGDRTQCMSAWAEEIGIKYTTIRQRLRLGWSDVDALTRPLR